MRGAVALPGSTAAPATPMMPARDRPDKTPAGPLDPTHQFADATVSDAARGGLAVNFM